MSQREGYASFFFNDSKKEVTGIIVKCVAFEYILKTLFIQRKEFQEFKEKISKEGYNFPQQKYTLNSQYSINYIEEMFKSASTLQFANTPFGSNSNLALNAYTYEVKSPVQIRPKKLAVKFEIEDEKENSKSKIDIFDSPTYQRKDKHTKTWTHHRIPSQMEMTESKYALKESKDGLNYEKRLESKFHEESPNFKEKFYQTDSFAFSSKKCIKFENKKYLEEPSKFTRSYEQCKSMKTLPSYNPDEQIETSLFQAKRPERKFQKFQAFNDLLKQSQNLLQKYKKFDNQKTQLKSDLKNQIQNHSKSSKKIVFLEEIEVSKRFEKTEKPSYSTLDVKQHKSKDYNMSSPKYNSFDKYESPKYESKYDSKYELKISTPSYETAMSKTFSSNSNKSYQTYDSNSNSYNGSFGLNKSPSSKKLCPSGISLDDFQLGKSLGTGAFGQVFQAKHKSTGWLFALKKIKKVSVKHMLDQFIQEIKIQLFLDHPNIVKLYSFFNDELHFYILMEYMEGGSLYSYLKKKKSLTLQETSLKLGQVCQGLQYMHQNQILHRDIKPQNIVLSYNVSKLCDFGWSAICKDRRTTYCGTLDYVCPQIIEGDGYDDSVDVWCVGVLAYELLVGKTPFYNISRKQTMKKIVDCDLQYPSTMPEVAVKFVKNILKKNPEHRQSIQQILKDPLLKIAQNANSPL